MEPLPHNAVTDKQIVEPRVVGEAIQRAIAKSGTKTRQAVVAVSGASVITKIIQMPDSLGELDLEEQIRAEADQYIPYPVEEVNLDFEVIGRTPGGSGTNDVLLAACRKEQVEQRSAVLGIGGLTPAVVDIEMYALENACQLLAHQMPDMGRGKTIALIDMGANTTSMMILHNFEAVYTRDQAFGARQLNEDVMRSYGLSLEEAARAMRTGDLPESYLNELVPSFIGDMAQQIDRSLQFFFSTSTQYAGVDQIILGGGCALIGGVEAQLQERLRVPVTIARPFANMTTASRVRPQQLSRDEPTLLIAAGLAIRSFDE